MRAAPSNVSELRGAVGAAYWPRFFHGVVGVGLDLATGLGAHLQNSAFIGTFEDWAIIGSLRARAFLSPRLVLEPMVGTTLHITQIEGTALASGTAVEINNLDDSFDVALAAEYRFGSVGLGLFAGGDYLFRYQHYTAQDRPVLALSPFIAELGFRVSLGVF